ncbi:MAG: hypothetical protein AAB789_01960 [Patescibacteria group bacterium]
MSIQQLKTKRTLQICVTVDVNQYDFIKNKGFKMSSVLRQAIYELMDRHKNSDAEIIWLKKLKAEEERAKILELRLESIQGSMK